MGEQHCDAIVCGCSDFRQIDDMRRWTAEKNLTRSADGLDIPAGAARLVVGDAEQRSVLMKDLVLLLGHEPRTIWLIAHEECAGIRDRGIKFTTREEEIQHLRDYAREAASIILNDDRFQDVPNIRAVVATKLRPDSDVFEFEEISFMNDKHAERSTAPKRQAGPPSAKPRAQPRA